MSRPIWPSSCVNTVMGWELLCYLYVDSGFFFRMLSHLCASIRHSDGPYTSAQMGPHAKYVVRLNKKKRISASYKKNLHLVFAYKTVYQWQSLISGMQQNATIHIMT
jgi:hypothetical protein